MITAAISCPWRANIASSASLVVERRHQRLLHDLGREAGAVGQRRLGQAGAGAQQHRVGVAVIAAVELQNLRVRPVAARATRSADITASVPEFTNRMLSTQGTRAVISSASSRL